MNFVEAKPLPGQNQARGHHSSHLPAEDDLRAQAVDVKPLASAIQFRMLGKGCQGLNGSYFQPSSLALQTLEASTWSDVFF